MRRLPAPSALRVLRVHPNGAVGVLHGRATLPSPGGWTLELSAPAALSSEHLTIQAKGARVLGAQCERFSEDRVADLRRVWVEVEATSAGPIELQLEGRLGWASWRTSSLCVQRPDRLDWSMWAEFWLEALLEPGAAALELSTRRLPPGSPAARDRWADEIAALTAPDKGRAFDLAADHPDAPRLLDPEPEEALGQHGLFRPEAWALGPDGTGRARLRRASSPLPSGCEVRPGRDGRPVARLVFRGPCPVAAGLPAGLFVVEAFGQRHQRSIARWPSGTLRAVELGPDPGVEVTREVEASKDGPRQDVALSLLVRTSRPAQVHCVERVPRSVDPQLRVDLYALEPRDTPFEEGVLDFRAALQAQDRQRFSTSYAVTCPPGQHAVRVPEGPE